MRLPRDQHSLRVAALALLVVLLVFDLMSPAIANAAPNISPEQQGEADMLFAQGRDLLEKGRYVEACEKLQKSDKLAPAVGTLLNLGFCWEQVAHMRSAMDAYSEAEILAREGGDHQRSEFARERFAAVEAKVMKLVIRVDDEAMSGLAIKRNGEEIPRTDWGKPIAVDPDDFVVTATAPGHVPWRGALAGKGEGAVLTIVVPPLETTRGIAKNSGGAVLFDNNKKKLIALTFGGFAIGTLAAGTALAFSAKSRDNAAHSHCDGTGCDQTGLDLQSGARAEGNIATAFVIVGVLSLGAGVYFWLTSAERSRSSALLEQRARIVW